MPRRGNGRGSIQQRGERYVAVHTLGQDEKGRQRRKTSRFDTREEAEAWLRRQNTTPNVDFGFSENALAVCLGRETLFSTFLTTWLSAKRHQVREKTWREYERVVRLHLVPSILGPIALGALTPLHIERLMLNLLTAGHSATLAFVVLRVVKLALGQAVDWGLLPFNPAARVKAPKRPRKEMRVWTPQQARTFLDACRKHQPRLYPLFYLALTTGMRRGELLGLHWDDVHLDRGELLVRFSLVQCGPKAVLSDPKTPASRRRVLLSPDTVTVLREHCTRQEAEKGRWKECSPPEEGLVFPSTVGRFQLPCTLVRIFHKLVVLAGVPDVRLHDLRHTAASLLVRRGVPIKAVAERLGHRDASLTLRVYTHVYEEQRREAVLSLDQLLGEPK